MDKATQNGLWVLLQAVLTHAHVLPEPLVKQVRVALQRLAWPGRVIDVACPRCGAEPRRHCRPEPGCKRRTTHIQRYAALGMARATAPVAEGGEERLSDG